MLFHILLFAVALSGGFVCRGQTAESCPDFCPASLPTMNCGTTCVADVQCSDSNQLCCPDNCGPTPSSSCMPASQSACDFQDCGPDSMCPTGEVCTLVQGCSNNHPRCLIAQN